VRALLSLVLSIASLALAAPSWAQPADGDPYRAAAAALLAGDMPAFERAIATLSIGSQY